MDIRNKIDTSNLGVAIDCSCNVSAFYLLIQRMMMTYCTRKVYAYR